MLGEWLDGLNHQDADMVVALRGAHQAFGERLKELEQGLPSPEAQPKEPAPLASGRNFIQGAERIRLANGKMFINGQFVPAQGTLWDIRLSDVSAWTFGSMSTES